MFVTLHIHRASVSLKTGDRMRLMCLQLELSCLQSDQLCTVYECACAWWTSCGLTIELISSHLAILRPIFNTANKLSPDCSSSGSAYYVLRGKFE